MSSVQLNRKDDGCPVQHCEDKLGGQGIRGGRKEGKKDLLACTMPGTYMGEAKKGEEAKDTRRVGEVRTLRDGKGKHRIPECKTPSE